MSRPLIPIDYDDEEDAGSKAAKKSGSSSSTSASSSKGPGGLTKRQKEMVSKIPHDKDVLWKYPIDWVVVDRENMVPNKLRPWVIKKIKELLGEEEQTLIDFICTKLSNHCRPQELLTELKLVLEDDAELFVQKLWKIMIYYIIETTA